MVKLYTEEIEHCGECTWSDIVFVAGRESSEWKCENAKDKIIKDLWGEIPSWCLLPEKVTDEVILKARDVLDNAEVPMNGRMLK